MHDLIGFAFKICKEFLTFNNKEINNKIEKRGQRSETASQEEDK